MGRRGGGGVTLPSLPFLNEKRCKSILEENDSKIKIMVIISMNGNL